MSNTTPKHSDSASESGKPKAKALKKKDAMRALRSVHPVAILSLILSLAALASIAYIGVHGLTLEQQLSETGPRLKKLDTELFLQANQLASTKANLEPLQKKTKNLDKRSERLLVDVSALSTKVRALEGSSRADSHLAEVEYLLRLANQRVLMSADIEGADKLLHSADEILLALDDYNLFPVREALAEDIAALNAVPHFDLEGAYFRLQAINGYIQALPLLKNEHFNPPNAAIEQKEDKQFSEDSGLQTKTIAILDGLWQSFANLFRFSSNRDQTLTELLTPEQEGMLRQKLQLLIEQSKLALLAQKPAIYKGSLLEAEQWLSKYFSHNAGSVDAIRQELSRLVSLDITPRLPTVNVALEALKQYRSQSPVIPTLKPVVKDNLDHLPLGKESHSKFSPPVDVSADVRNKSGEAQL